MKRKVHLSLQSSYKQLHNRMLEACTDMNLFNKQNEKLKGRLKTVMGNSRTNFLKNQDVKRVTIRKRQIKSMFQGSAQLEKEYNTNKRLKQRLEQFEAEKQSMEKGQKMGHKILRRNLTLQSQLSKYRKKAKKSTRYNSNFVSTEFLLRQRVKINELVDQIQIQEDQVYNKIDELSKELDHQKKYHQKLINDTLFLIDQKNICRKSINAKQKLKLSLVK